MSKNQSKELKIKFIDAYMQHILEENRPPDSVYSFTKKLSLKEADFYVHFASFKSIESNIFSEFFHQAVQLLEKNKEYTGFDAQNKLLSLYFTLFEIFKANRSYILLVLNQIPSSLESKNELKSFKKLFKNYVEALNIESIDLKQVLLDEIKKKGILDVSWKQFIFILEFWIKDNSLGFEKTDILIEKSIKTGFDLLDITPVKSILDLSKFLIKEHLK